MKQTRDSSSRVSICLLLLSVAGVIPCTLAAPGDVDGSYDPALNDVVYSTAIQPDKKILIVGFFTSAGGATRNRIARLNPDGTLDTGFDPNANSSVYALAVQRDGKIVIGGFLTAVGGAGRNYVARLNADGTLDTDFNPNVDWFVYCTTVQVDGKILLGGTFTTVGNTPRSRIARLNADGTLDLNFDPNAAGFVKCLGLQSDGKILIGGGFTTVGGITRSRIARLHGDGTADLSFSNSDANSGVYALAVQADGKIVIGGYFTTIGGTTRKYVARLNTDGTLDPGFNPNPNGEVESVALQADGKIIIGGWFSTVGGTLRDRLARLNADGTLDLSFKGSRIGREVYSISVQPDGKVLTGGARLANDAATQNLTVPSSSRVEWRRGGASPEAEHVVFDVTRDHGTTWNELGSGTRIAGGWEIASLNLPANCLVRGRGQATDSGHSPGLVEAMAAFPSNAPPTVANPVTGIGVNEDAPDTVIDLRAVFQDAETADSNLIYSVEANGTPTLVSASIDNMTDKLTLHYATNQFGASSITVRATDELGLYAEDTFLVTVNVLQDGDPGDVDMGFKADTNLPVHSTAVQPDGKIVIGGDFSNVGGVARWLLARVNAEGTVDPDFKPVVDDEVSSLAIQVDGKVVIGGWFTTASGMAHNSLARLNADGRLDSDFNPTLGGAGAHIYCISLQADGKIVIAGSFTNVNATARTNIARLNADGTLDNSFNPNANGVVYSSALDASGKIVIGGWFTGVGGMPRTNVARLNSDGTVDTNFNPNVNSSVTTIALQLDGKVVIGGNFTTVDGMVRNHFARLNIDGTSDFSFDPKVRDETSLINSTVVQTDGRIVIGGVFTAVGGMERNNLARLNADGTLDIGFNPDVHGNILPDVYTISLQADGKIVMGGWFTSVGGVARGGLARLLNDAVTNSLTVPSASRVEWLRGGASPQAQCVTFELSTNGATWSALGVGTRIAGGWELTGLSLPATGQVRARARVTGGRYNGSSGLVETVTAYSLAFVTSPRLVGPTLLSNGAFQFGFTNQSGVPFSALATTNLTLPSSNWTVLGSATEIFPGQFQFTDPAAKNFPTRFYQIRSP